MIRLGLILGLVLATSSLAEGPSFEGLGAVGGVETPGTQVQPTDSLDALLRDLPGGSAELEDWYQEWKDAVPEEAANQTDPVVGARKTFSGFFGETSWTAAQNREAVLRALEDLTPPRESDPERTALLEAMLRALASHATDPRTHRGTDRKRVHRGGRSQTVSKPAARPSGSAEEVYQRLRSLAEAGIGPRSAGILEEMNFTRYDFKAAAFVLLQHVQPRRQSVEDQELDFLLQNPPDPAEDAGIEEILRAAKEARAEAKKEGTDAEAKRLDGYLEELKDLAGRRQKAARILREALGEDATTGPELMGAALRRRVRSGEPLPDKLREALLELARVDAQMARISDLLSMPGPEEVALQEDDAQAKQGKGLFRSMDATSLGRRLSKEVLDADLKLGLKLFDLELAPGVSLSGKYQWELEGGERKDTWNRVDEWELKAKLGVGDWIQDVFELPFSVGIDHTRKILLVREFESWKEASLAIPKAPLALPLTAEKAREMPMGYFWSLPVQMSAVASLAFGYGQGFVDARAYSNYILTGRFRLNFFKEDEHKLRVQLIGAKEQGPGFGTEVKLGFEILGVKLLDRALSRLIDLRVLRQDRTWRKGVGVALDYVYDLDSPEAAAAFEKVVRVGLGWGGMLASNPLLKARGLEDRLLTDLRPTEKLFLEDRGKPLDERRVDRRFLATNQFQSRNRSFRIGPRLARYGKQSRWVENLLTITEQDGSKQFYQFPMYNHWRGWQVLFGWLKESGEIQVFSLMSTEDQQGQPAGPQPLLMKAMISDRSASSGEIEKVRGLATHSLGPFLSQQIGVDSAVISRGGKSFRAHILVALHPEATGKIFDPSLVSEQAVAEAAQRAVGADDREHFALDGRAKRMVEAFLLAREIPGVPGNHQQIRALIRLGETPDWREHGSRFLLEMLGEAPTTQEVHLDVAWSGKGVESFAKTYGSSRHEDLYLIVSEALSAVADRDRPEGH